MADDYVIPRLPAEQALALLAVYDKARVAPGDAEVMDLYLTRLLREAQVNATLAVARELELQRMAGWGQRA